MQCERELSWVGLCTKQAVTTDPALCAEHSEDKCWCSERAVRDCAHAGSFVCGRPLCASHECPAHSLNGARDYQRFRYGDEMAEQLYEDALQKYRDLAYEHNLRVEDIAYLKERMSDIRSEAEHLRARHGLDVEPIPYYR